MTEIPQLTGQEKSQLRGRAMALPVRVVVGKEGITPALLSELDKALSREELVKVRFSVTDKTLKAELLEGLSQAARAAIAGTVGHTAALYRPKPEAAQDS